jgi:hypothetical protein
MTRYTATKQTVEQFRRLSPMTLEGALHVDTESCVYDAEPPAEVLAACPVVTEITAGELADLRNAE